MAPDDELVRLARLVREAARDELLPRFTRVTASHKADGSVLTEADLAMESRLRSSLAEAWPEVAFMSEEMDPAEQQRLLGEANSGLWCLDPLDGTSNFAAGIPLFGVSIALLQHGRVHLAVIYDPVRDECFTAGAGSGAHLNGAALNTTRRKRPIGDSIAVVDLKRLKPGLRDRLVAAPPYHSQRNFGSCALEWAWMAAGRGDLYLHGGQKLWDLAAGCLLLDEAGGASFTLEGDAVFDGTLVPRSVVAAADRGQARSWLEWLQAIG